MSYDFTTQLTVGKAGETAFRRYLQGVGYTVRVGTLQEDRWRGIDLVAARGDRTITFQVKCETYLSGNLAIEIWSRAGVLGGHLTSKAQYIVHILPNGVVYTLEPARLRLCLAAYFRDYPLVAVPNKNYTTQVVLLPITTLRDRGCILNEVCLPIAAEQRRSP